MTGHQLFLNARRALVALTLLALAAPAAAQAATPSQVGAGLHIASGALVDPAGRTWVSDHNGGFCRMTEATDDAPGQIEHPQWPGDTTTTRTCLGGLLPHAAPGPDAAGAPSFHDPSPEFPSSGDEIAYVPDGASPSANVLRLRWDPDTELFSFDAADPADTIVMDADVVEPDRPRPTHTALGPDGNLYVVFQRSATIQRVLAPESATPTPQVIGQTSDGAGALSLTAGRDDDGAFVLYVGEPAGIRMLRPNALLPNQVTLPTPYDIGLNDPQAVLTGREGAPALAFDYDDGILYAGTASELAPPGQIAGVDDVYRFDVDFPNGGSNADDPYATGFSMVGGMAIGLGDELLVLDDRALLDPAEPLGEGRLFRVGPPGARITFGPSTANQTNVQSPDRAFTNNTRPTFRFAAGPARECSLQPSGQPRVWTTCTTTTTYRPPSASPLVDGESYVFSVRSIDGALTGQPDSHTFTVDTTAPVTPTIARPTGAPGVVEPQRPYVELSSSETDMGYACKIGGSSSFNNTIPCDTGRPFDLTGQEGSRTLRVWAVDRAGNVSSSPATRTFEVDGVLPEVALDRSPNADFTQLRSISFDYEVTNEDDDVQFGCRVNAETFAICPGTLAGVRSLGPNLPDGSYRFEVRARDSAGNVGEVVSRTVTVDTTKPAVDSTRLRAVTGPSGVFSLAANEPANFSCELDGAPTTCDTSLAFGSASISFNGLPDGPHTLRIDAVDRAGNASSHTHQFTVATPDTTPPTVTISAPAQGEQTQPNLYVVFAAADPTPLLTVQCRLDAVPVANCSSPHLLTDMPDGFHTFTVTARDGEGNTRTLTRTWEVKRRGQGGADEAIPPVPTVTNAGPPNGPQGNGPGANRVAVNGLALNPLTGDPLALGSLRVSPLVGQGAAGPTAAGVDIAVTLVADPGTRVVRLRVFQTGGAPARAAASKRKRKLVAREFRRVKAERRVRLQLSRKAVRKLRPGRRYVLEVTPGTSRDTLGLPKTRRFKLSK
ncbi:MAG TPA: Ig-like domain repeat protein [Thermoleophilaceae bacterium]|nr:Ig-like domain repeat protein [Thermoleophilaceae bacterium]